MLSPEEAYEKAIIEGPSAYTRKAVLSSPYYSYYYAIDIDKCSRDNIRNAVLSSPLYSYLYALDIDQSPRDDTRNAVLFSADYSYWYALHVDENIFTDSNDYHYFVDIHNIGMRYIRENKYDVGFMSVGCLYLDVL